MYKKSAFFMLQTGATAIGLLDICTVTGKLKTSVTSSLVACWKRDLSCIIEYN